MLLYYYCDVIMLELESPKYVVIMGGKLHGMDECMFMGCALQMHG